jgi:thioredoxin 1
MAEHNATEETFQQEVLAESLPVLVDFSAEWCGPCKMVDPIVHELSEDWDGRVKVVKVDVDAAPGILNTYGILGIPTLMLFINGEVRERVTGYQPKKKLIAKFEPHLA